MDARYELMISAHEADMEREARERRQASALVPCRRTVLGLPIGRPCETVSTC